MTAVERLTEAVVEAANIIIPRPKETNYHKSKFTLWWKEQCAQAINDIKHASNRSNKHKATENPVNIKIFRAVARRTLRNSKRRAWNNYVSSLNSATPLSSIGKR